MLILKFREMVTVLSATVSSYDTSSLIAILAITAVAWILLFIFLLSGEATKPQWQSGAAGRRAVLIWSAFWVAGAVSGFVACWGFFAWRLSNGLILVPTVPNAPIGVIFGYGLVAAGVLLLVGWVPKALLPKIKDTAETPEPVAPPEEEGPAYQPLYPELSFDASHQPARRTTMEQPVPAAPQQEDATAEEEESRPRRGRLPLAVGGLVLAVIVFGAVSLYLSPTMTGPQSRFSLRDFVKSLTAFADNNGAVIPDDALDFQTDRRAIRAGDFAADVERWRSLAEQGSAAAQYKLGVLYANGRGAPRDYVEAYAWLNVAAARGDETAMAGRDAVARRMNPAQLETGQERARDRYARSGGAPFSGEVPARLKSLSARDLVFQVQRLLNARGFNVGVADGVPGPRTRAAVRAFESQHGLAKTGKITPELVARLENSVPGTSPSRALPGAGGGWTLYPPQARVRTVAVRPAAPVTDCDRLAAHPSSGVLSGGVAGVMFARIDPSRAIPACERAVAKYPEEPRFQFELARSLHKAERYSDALAAYRKAGDGGSALAQRSVGLMYATGSGVARNLTKAARWLGLAAERCDADAQFALGTLYAKGEGVEKSEVESIRWIQLAAAQGHPEARNRLNEFAARSLRPANKFQPDDYTVERHVDRLLAKQSSGVIKAFEREDYSAALNSLRPLAEKGEAPAQTLLGYMYRSGLGIEYDYTRAVEWFRKAAEQDDADAHFLLGYMYQHGFGVLQDFAQALQWYRRSALQGVAAARVALGMMYDNAQGVAPDPEESLAQYRSAAEAGLAAAQHRVGVAYETGDGVPRDLDEAIKWYRLAAAQKFALSQNKLGELYDRGRGVPRDAEAAVGWYRRAADQGLPDAEFNLAQSLAAGRGVAGDPAAALKLYIEAAEQGHADAQLKLGFAYFRGRGVAQSYSEAASWFRKAAAQCNADAQYQLATMYRRGEGVAEASAAEEFKWLKLAAEQGQVDALNALSIRYAGGSGVKKDPVQAFDAMRRAAEGGHPAAQYKLAEAYAEGSEAMPQDFAKAAEWYRKAAAQGNVNAQYKLAELYRNGLGVPRSYVEAVKLYSTAALQGDLLAQRRLASAYRLGAGVPRDQAQAIGWYRQAAEQGDPGSQRELGLYFLRGEGVLQDYVQAHLWLSLAASNGDPEAKSALGRLAGNMTPKQIAEAERLAEEQGASGG